MNVIDIILALILLYFAYKGFSTGFIISVTTLLGLICGFYAASYFSEYTANWLSTDLGFKSQNLKLISYILTFVIVVVLVFLLGKFMTSVVKTVGLGILNRLAGAALGIVKGALIASFIFMLINRIDPAESLLSRSNKSDSIMYKPVSSFAPLVIPLLKKYTIQVKEAVGNIADKNKDESSTQEQ
jgi:membrane protein required for colicin V production